MSSGLTTENWGDENASRSPPPAAHAAGYKSERAQARWPTSELMGRGFACPTILAGFVRLFDGADGFVEDSQQEIGIRLGDAHGRSEADCLAPQSTFAQ